MRRVRVGMGWLGAVLLGLTGCYSTGTDSNPKPSLPPEQLVVPPANDPRFSRPIEFPKEALNQDIFNKKDAARDNGLPSTRSPSRLGMGAGAGGY